MTDLVLPLEHVTDKDRLAVGGKALALARLLHAGFPVPETLCIGFEAYRRFVASTRLADLIVYELNRKDFDEMRWEEVWDTALRIRSLFVSTDLTEPIRTELLRAVEEAFGGRTLVVRSSAAGEDGTERSFAGLHDSFVNISGTDSVLEHIKRVWASLWSDRALIYRRELGLDIEKSAMGVLVQEVVAGECSGVAFSRSPTDGSQAVIEAVHGLNLGLVDGAVEPDRWFLDRETGRVLGHAPAKRKKAARPAAEGTRYEELSPEKSEIPPLDRNGIMEVFELARRAEKLFGPPQDVEWTIRGANLVALQSRPVTTLKTGDGGDKRPWYLSLTRSFENLKALRRTIEEHVIPGMERDAERLARVDIEDLSGAELDEEIERRKKLLEHWKAVYWRDCIPFAHGMRLFGQVYNDAVRPDDPFEFVDLLRSGSLAGLERNRRLEELAGMLRKDPASAATPSFESALQAFIDDYGNLFSLPEHGRPGGIAGGGEDVRRSLIELIGEMAKRPPSAAGSPAGDPKELAKRFFERLPEERRTQAEELLDLARASYRLRDDDNISLEKVRAQIQRALEEKARRKGAGPEDRSRAGSTETVGRGASRIRARQLVGQPAGPGLARGTARVICGAADLFAFKAGEILVCDAVSPEMTFVAPLAAGIVERRGGMLIHGAIIAREYGLPCVTGVPQATSLIAPGARVTVDGYLGIVIVG